MMPAQLRQQRPDMPHIRVAERDGREMFAIHAGADALQ